MYFGTYLTLVFTTLLWGGTFIAGRTLAGAVPPFTAAFFRFALASIALLILRRMFEGPIKLPPRMILLPLFFLGVTGVFSYNACFFTGLQYIEAGRASLIIALNPLAITLCAAVFLHEKLGLHHIFGILLSLIGAIFVISNGHPSLILSGNFGKGELAILGCVASWAAYSIIGKTVLQVLSPLTAVLYSSMIGTVLLFVPALYENSLGTALSYSPTSWISLIFLGVFGTAVGFSLYYRAIRTIGPTRSGVFINLVPLFAIILSWLILGETIQPTVLIGGIILIGGVSLTNSHGRLQMVARRLVKKRQENKPY